MAVINSVLGKMTGKLGNVVLASNAGEVIAREYNPNVSNPNTTAQQATRARFKLASQLSEAMSPVIAIRKEGMRSARNIFVQVNYENTRMSDNVATIDLNKVKLTKSNSSFAGFSANRAGANTIVQLLEGMSGQIDKVVYIQYKKNADASLSLVDSITVETPGANGQFEGQLSKVSGAVVCYAYGIKVEDGAVAAKFGSLQANSAEEVAKLLVSSTENYNGVKLTKTAGLTMLENETSAESDDETHILVSVIESGNGSATGGGRYIAGQTVTLIATPDAEASFVAWKRNNASGAVLSTNAQYSFEAQDDITICAVFQGGPTPHYTVSLQASPAGDGTVSGGGSFEEGAICTAVATPASGKVFTGWYNGSTLVDSNASYAFAVLSNITLTAHFADAPASQFSNVIVDGSAFTSNTDIAMPKDVAASGSYAGQNATHVGWVKGTSQGPTVGSTVTPYSTTGELINGNFSFTIRMVETDIDPNYYLCALIYDSGNQSYSVESVYDYKVTPEP